MAGYYFSMLELEALEAALAPPAQEVTALLCKGYKRIKDRWRISTFPEDSKAYPEALAEFIARKDWYAGLSEEDGDRVPELFWDIVALAPKRRPLFTEFINGEEDEGMESIYWPLIDVIRGGVRLDSIAAKKKTVNFTDFEHGKQSEGPKVFREFGLRPFRCPNFDVAKAIKRGFDSGGSVHGPEDVIKMREILEEATPVLSRLDPDQEGFSELGEFKFFREVLDRSIEKNRGLLVAVDT